MSEAQPVSAQQPIDNTPRIFLFITAIALIVGTLLPWGVVRSVGVELAVNGYEGDGILTGGIGIILLVVAAGYKASSRILAVALTAALSVIVLWLSIPKLFSMDSASTSAVVTISAGSGLILTIIGGVIGLIAAVVAANVGQK